MIETATEETNDAYHADTTCVSASMLKALRQSPRIYEARYVTGEIESTETPAMKLGTAVHCLALEPDRFAVDYPVMPAFERDEENVTASGKRSYSKATTYYKQSVERWQQENKSASVLTEDERLKVERCVASLRSIPLCRTMLDHSQKVIEQSIRWTDSITGVPCKAKCDLVIESLRIIVDVKTVAELDQRAIAYACQDFGYHIQDAHYRIGWANVTGTDVDDWQTYFAFVETKPPYRSRLCMLSWESQTKGMDERQALISDWLCRTENKDWSETGEHELTEVTLPMLWRKNGN